MLPEKGWGRGVTRRNEASCRGEGYGRECGSTRYCERAGRVGPSNHQMSYPIDPASAATKEDLPEPGVPCNRYPRR
eukprot:scaffold223843_cov24-Tisochrysis_lutea.AAC.3